MEKIMEGRSLYVFREGDSRIAVTTGEGSFFVNCAMPIITEGDVVGCVASLRTDEKERRSATPIGDVENKLIQTAAGFLGRQLES